MTSTVRLYLLHYGETGPLPDGAGGSQRAQIYGFALTHPRGTVVIDGGYGSRAVERTGEGPSRTVLTALAEAGIDPKSVRWIVQSHLHADLTGAVHRIEHFPNAEVLATRTEYEWALAPDRFIEVAYPKVDFAKPGVPWVLLDPIDDGYDLFGDGTLRCWRTPGHTPGHQSFEVTLRSGLGALFPMDAAPRLQIYQRAEKTQFQVSLIDTERSIDRLHRIAWRSEAMVVCSHDELQWPTLRRAPEFYD